MGRERERERERDMSAAAAATKDEIGHHSHAHNVNNVGKKDSDSLFFPSPPRDPFSLRGGRGGQVNILSGVQLTFDIVKQQKRNMLVSTLHHSKNK